MALPQNSNDGLADQKTLRSNWQAGTPERVMAPTSKEPVVMKHHQIDEIDDVFGGTAGQLSDAAHHLSCRGT